MRISLRFTLSLLLSGLTLWCSAAPAQAVVELKFGVYTTDKPTAMVTKFRPVLKHLEAQLAARLQEDVRIRIDVANDYEMGVNRLADGEVDFSRLGPASYVAVREQDPGVEVLAVELRNGGKTFNGVICVAADSPIQSLEDLRGSRFAFGNERSTIGRYLAQQLLIEHGILSTELEEFAYLDRHDLVAAAVAAGEFDAGAVKETTFTKAANDGKSLRAIAHFPNVTKPWVASSRVSKPIREALKQALLELDDPTILRSLKVEGFTSGDDADYAPIRTAIQSAAEF